MRKNKFRLKSFFFIMEKNYAFDYKLTSTTDKNFMSD